MSQDPPNSPEKGSSAGKPEATGLLKFWQELRRRKVMRVALVYVVAAWLLIQVADTVFPQFGIPVWASTFVTLLLTIGFPIALIMAWAFELTPDGIRTTKAAQSANKNKEEDSSHTKKRNLTAYLVGAAIPTIIFGAIILFFYGRSPSENTVSEAAVEESDKSIAVLPFADMSEDGGNEYFSDGISEELLNVLAKVSNLRVPARTSSFFFKGKNMPVQEIGQELNVQYVLEGSVRKAGDRIPSMVGDLYAGIERHLCLAG
jgi:hypothetical protein